MSHTIPYVPNQGPKPFIPVGLVLENGVYLKGRRFLVNTAADVVLIDTQLVTTFGVKTTRKKPRQLKNDWIVFGSKRFQLSFADVEFSLKSNEGFLRWNGIAGFWDSPVAYGIFGQSDALELFDATFHPFQKQLVLEPNAEFGDVGGLSINR